MTHIHPSHAFVLGLLFGLFLAWLAKAEDRDL